MKEKNSKEIFARNLKYLFTKYDIEQNIMAEKLNITPSAITEWVKGRKFPRIDTLQALGDYFNVSISNLIEDNLETTLNNLDDTFKNDLIFRYGKSSDKLLNCYAQLNDLGKNKAIENIQDLTKINEYTEKKTDIHEA